MNVLACDLGGTHTRVRLTRCDGDTCAPRREQFYPSAAYPGLAPILQEFLAGLKDPEEFPRAACIALAGPVTAGPHGQCAKVTNLPWQLDSGQLGAELGIARVALINDFEAIGYGIEVLRPDDLVTLQEGSERPNAVRAIIGAGTGLGEAILVKRGAHYQVLPSEGGHADFAPTDELQIELLRHLRREGTRASYENLISGPGLTRIYRFLRDRSKTGESPSLRKAMEQQDPAAAISELGLSHRDPLANRALDLFVSIYGAQAGNLALTCMAAGGVYLAGGIAPQIIERLQHGPFLGCFRNKGKMSSLMMEFPVRVIGNAKVGLLGAVQVAARL